MPFPKTIDFNKLTKRLEAHEEGRLPFALYRKPGQEYVWAVFQDNNQLLKASDFAETGFYVAPFNGDKTPIRIRPDRIFRSRYIESGVVKNVHLPDEDLAARELFTEAVRRAVSEIQNKQLDKVVLSRRLSVPFQTALISFFKALLNNYPSAYCYMWYHPDAGTWAGASPELLLQYDGQTARTESLAGTLPVETGVPPDWTGKETNEQGVVTDYIEECIRKVGGNPVREPLETIQAGPLWHLRTSLHSDMDPVSANRLLNTLHPTPAVCGYPLGVAMDQIARLENYDREYYTGFLGDSGLQGNNAFQFFVNLRCLQIRGAEAYIYVGCGITHDSDPQNEWEETRQKSRTMLAVLENSRKTMG